MAEPEPKSDQVRRLEEILQRPLWPCLTDDVLGWGNRKCYTLDADGNITGLNLARCGISDWSFLRELGGLTSLDLSRNEISDGSFLRELVGLTSLDLGYNSISDGAFLRELVGLTSLSLSHNGISDWSFLRELVGLTSLDLSDNEISDGAFLRELRGLTSLDLSGNEIFDGSFLRKLRGLRSLDLIYNSDLDWSSLCECELRGLTSLSLSGNEISDWSSLCELRGLTSLSLSGNEIVDWSFLRELVGLTSLSLSWNGISDWSFLRELRGLTSLDLVGNEISDGSFLRELRGLTSLDLSDNEISDGAFLRELRGLTSLDLGNNRISDGAFLRELRGLTSLDLSRNGISDWSFLHNLRGLTSLDLRRNGISDGAFLHELLTSPVLRTLNLEGNSLRELPAAIFNGYIRSEFESRETHGGSLPQSINLFGNPLESPPKELVEQGHAAVLAWFRDLAVDDDGERPLEEVKVILVGDGGAGKTSLRKRLMGGDFNESEQQTRGIELQDWSVAVDDWNVQTGRHNVTVHFWDFGGQVINHATHQFFLSRRSLYLLVLDGRKDEDAEYWLKLIETFGGESPVLVVLNKMDENPGFEVNRSFLADKYPGLNPDRFFRVSCWKKRGSGISELKKALLKELPDVDLVRTTWPGKWFAVKQQLEDINDDYIDYDRFEKICVDAGIDQEDTHKSLVRFLNDLGVALHFPDLGTDHLQVLNPRWATQAVYRIINAEQLATGHGILPLTALKKILRKTQPEHFTYPESKHHYIINLMKKFEVCYELNPQTILVPDLLDVAEPKFEFPTENLLRFRYEYDFLPRSVLPRFIVRWHADIDDALRWRTGVVVKDKDLNARAVVWSDVRDRKIMIDVAGRDRREYFRRIRAEFRRIHDSFQKLDVTEKVPLPDEPGYDVDYLDLLFHEEKRRETILVGGLRREYNVRQLLDGIASSEQRDRDRRDSNEKRQIHVHGDYYEGSRMRDQFRVNIGDHNQIAGLNIGNDITAEVKQKIETAWQQASEADETPTEIKELLQKLTQAVADIASQSHESAEGIANDLQTLTAEATSQSPRRRHLEFSLDGIKEAAAAFGDVGKTAIGLVTQLAPLLIP